MCDMQDARGRSTRSSRRCDPGCVGDSGQGDSVQGDSGQYICIECSETFDTKLELNNHRQSHVTQKQFTCSHCGRGFHHQVFLEMHERSHEGGASPAPVTRTPGRVISTRSSRAAPTPDVAPAVPPPPKQPGHQVNSTVDFRRDRAAAPAFTPLECVTRRTQGTSQPPCQRRDPAERKNRFELRIAKVLDSTIHIIDPYGNTLEILSDVFNKYTICDTEEDPPAGGAQGNTSLSGPPPAEGEEAMEEGPSCDRRAHPLDDGEASCSAPASSDKGASPDHSTTQPDSDGPKNPEIPETATVDPSLNQSELHPDRETGAGYEPPASGVSLVDSAVSAIDGARLDMADDGCSALRVDLLDQERDTALMNSDLTCMESSSAVGDSLAYETPAPDLPEKVLQDDGNHESDSAEKGIGFLDALCDTTNPSTRFDMSLSGWEALSRRVNHGQILDQQSDTETSDIGDGKLEEDERAPELNTSQSYPGEDNVTSGETDLTLSVDPSEKDAANHNMEETPGQETKKGQPDLDVVAQGEKSSVFSAESCVSPPERGPLSQAGDKKAVSLVEDETFMMEQIEADLSERDDRDLFDGRDILPLDAQVEVGEKIHITNESNAGNDLTETESPENLIPINEATHEKNTTDGEMVKSDLQRAWLRTSREEQNICQVSAPCQDPEPEIHPADKGRDPSLEDSRVPRTTMSAALLASEKPQEAAPSLAESKDIAHQPNPGQIQVITPDVHPVPETGMPSIGDETADVDGAEMGMMKMSNEGLTPVLHSSSHLSVTTSGAESTGHLAPEGCSAVTHEEVSMSDDVNEGVSEQDENQSSRELCILQSTVSPAPTQTGDMQKMALAERGLGSDGLKNERAEGVAERVPEGHNSESKDLDDRLFRERLEKPQFSPVSSFDSPLHESEETSGPVSYIPVPGEEPAGDIAGAITAAPSQEDAADVPEALLLTDDADMEETTEVKSPDGSLGASSQCLKCGRRVRRGRKETIWTQVCYKCRLVEKRKERHTNKETGKEEYESLLSDFQIKQEADKEDLSEETMRPAGDKEQPYKCQKCEQSFRIPALLAGHMKCHALPQCLTCGCPMKLKYKTRRIVRRCQKCVQEIKEQRNDRSSDEESLESDDEMLLSSDQSDDLSENELTSLKPHQKASDKLLKSKAQPARLGRGTELVRSVLLKKGRQGLYCACPASRTSVCKRPMKRCPHCQKLIRFTPHTMEGEELSAGHLSDHSDMSNDSDHDLKNKLREDFAEGKKKPVKRKPPCSGSEVPGGSSMTESNVFSCKKEDPESSSDEQVMSDLGLPDGEKPRLCPQCGKAFKCNRSLNLHLLSHTSIACESCGCRLQKKRRSGRWSKKCRICRIGSKPGRESADDDITSETSYPLQVKQTKTGKNKKRQTISKHKKDLKWMDRMLAVKRKQEAKNLSRSSSEPEDGAPTVIDEKFSVVAAPALDVDFQSLQQPGPSGLHPTPKKRGRKCLYREKNVIKVEENPLLSDLHNPAASMMPVSIKQEEENQCLECNQNFQTFDLLLIHQQSHVEGQPYSCPECPQTFSTEQYLTIHLNAHPEGRPFRCPECNKTFTRRNHLGVHLRVHSGIRPFACPDCPCKFRQKSSLIIHRYTHRNTDVLVLKPYQCSVCGKSFKQMQRLIVHERLHTGECPFSCKDCEQVFPSKARLYMHRKIHKMSALSPEAEPTLERKDGEEIQSFQCSDCDKVCSTKASFALHRKVHGPLSPTSKQEERPFHCKKCNKVFSSKARLSLHKKLHLKADIRGKPYICKVCNKACSTKASFALHSKVHKTLLKAGLVHKTFHCKECDVVSPNKASFILHSKMHKSSRAGSFSCKDCEKVCLTKASLVLHRRVHKLSNEQGQNLGGDVTEQDSSEEQLADHKKSQPEESHDPEQHPSNKEAGEPHKTDVNEKPFACPLCPMRFMRLKILVRHKMIHGDDGVFSCAHCGKRFLYHKSFVNHENICQSKTKGKSLLGHKKVTKRKAVKDGDSSLDQANTQKKRKISKKKTISEAQKEKNKVLKAKKLALIKEKSKIKSMKEKKKLKEKNSKAGADVSDMSHGKQEKPADSLPKEKKPKDVTKGQKTAKKASPKEKLQKSKSLKKWQIIASSAVHKRKLQAAITAGKKKVAVKKKALGKARPGGKEKN